MEWLGRVGSRTRSQPGSYLSGLIPGLLVLGFGLGLVNPAMQNAALHRVSASHSGLASGVQTTVMQVGSATGISVLIALATQHATGLAASGTAAAQATVAGYRFAFAIAGIVLVVGQSSRWCAWTALPRYRSRPLALPSPQHRDQPSHHSLG